MDGSSSTDFALLEGQAVKSFSAKQYDESERQYKHLIQERQKTDGLEATYRDRYNLAAVLIKKTNFEETESLLRDVLQSLQNRDVRDSKHVVQQESATRRLLAQTLEGQGKGEGDEAKTLTNSASKLETTAAAME